MRFLADENLPRTMIQALREGGADVRSVQDESRGAIDAAVLSIAMADARVLLTFDKDFGELAARADLPAGCGVILFRAPLRGGPEAARRLALSVLARSDRDGCFSVIEADRIRMRRLSTT